MSEGEESATFTPLENFQSTYKVSRKFVGWAMVERMSNLCNGPEGKSSDLKPNMNNISTDVN